MTGPLYLLFFLSGLSGLIYQVVWVRVFGNVFGNTLYSTALVVAVFMLGLGVGGHVVGAWADRRYGRQPDSLLRAYGHIEALIAVLGFGVSLLLPHLVQLSALVSAYSREASGWYALSATAYVARAAVALVLLTPITLLMGGTLTLLIRHLVGRDFEIGGRRIAVLYGVNTAGAALGCLLTDFALVPAYGLLRTQMIAVCLNAAAAAGAIWLSRPTRVPEAAGVARRRSRRATPGALRQSDEAPSGADIPTEVVSSVTAMALISLTLAMSGFAALGMEIVWFRHFTIMLGQFRAVFSLLLAVILIGIGAGSFASVWVGRRSLPAVQSFMLVQALFVATLLFGMASADASVTDAALSADTAFRAATGQAVAAEPEAGSGLSRTFREISFNVRPMLWEVLLPALLMGFSFPLANRVIQRSEAAVGRRAGTLYLANTVGAVVGSLATGFVLLPALGIQATTTVLALVAALSVVPLYLTTRSMGEAAHVDVSSPIPDRVRWRAGAALVASLIVAGVALALWSGMASDHIIARAMSAPENGEHRVRLVEGLNEVIAVTELSSGRTLVTNGHAMSSTRPLAQRYMRALAHIPLLVIEKPETVLVIGFGVGNTTHAATLHPSIRRVEVADLSRDVLHQADYFADANRRVLTNPNVVVYINDGRHHLQMQPPSSYDLVTLEPPPIAYAGVAALYSREFYELARTRLKPEGYVSQWLPAYQVPTETTLAMVRAFIDVFPQSVLLSGAEADLLLLGTNGARIEIDPGRLAEALLKAPDAQADLNRLDLGSVREIVGAFVGSAALLAEATRGVAPVTDDRPIQEYGVRSLLKSGEAVPGSVVDLSQVAAWCPKCFEDGRPVPMAAGLDTYLTLLDRAYAATPAEVLRARALSRQQSRTIAGSAYLGAIVPETADVYDVLGTALATRGELGAAIAEFRHAVDLEPESADAHWHLGVALASSGALDQAVVHLDRSVGLDAGHGRARYDLARVLLQTGKGDDAVEHLRVALRLLPDSAQVHNELGVALAWQGRTDEAVQEFQRALVLRPDFAEARRNLALAERQGQQKGNHSGRER